MGGSQDDAQWSRHGCQGCADLCAECEAALRVVQSVRVVCQKGGGVGFAPVMRGGGGQHHASWSPWIGQCGGCPSRPSQRLQTFPPAIADPPASFFQRNLRVVRDAPQLRRLVFGFACPEIGGYRQKRVFTFVGSVLPFMFERTRSVLVLCVITNSSLVSVRSHSSSRLWRASNLRLVSRIGCVNLEFPRVFRVLFPSPLKALPIRK